MIDLFYYLGYALVIAGGFFIFTGSIGLLRLPECITRIHAAGVADVFGACLILFGLAILSSDWGMAIKLTLLAFFLMITSPTACHALAKLAFETPEIKKRWQHNKGKEEDLP